MATAKELIEKAIEVLDYAGTDQGGAIKDAISILLEVKALALPAKGGVRVEEKRFSLYPDAWAISNCGVWIIESVSHDNKCPHCDKKIRVVK